MTSTLIRKQLYQFKRNEAKGDAALFGGFSTNDMKRKLGVAANRPLADFLPTLYH
jgi:DNA-damage-inducible protein D